MNKLKKIFVSAAMAVIMLVSAAAAVATTIPVGAEGEVNVNEPLTEQFTIKDEFTVGGWIQFYNTDTTPYLDQVEELANAGMNLILLPHNVSPGTGGTNVTTNYRPEGFYSALDALAQEINMYYMYQGTDAYDFEASYAEVKELANCIGYHLKDEPSSAQMDALAEYVRQFKAADPTRIPYVNLFPNYAGATNLGGTYRDYVTKWVNVVGPENMDWLYFDHYPFTQTEDVRSTYFSDLEVIRDVAYKNGKIKTGGFTQMGSWNGMTRPTPDMARWSVNSLLTYGLKSISHFCWVAPTYVAPENGGEGMRDFVTDSDGNPTDLYEPMSIVNWQTRQIGSVLMNLDVKHAYHTGKTPVGAEGLPSSFILQPGSASDGFVYSIAYTKDTNEPYLLVFNKALSGAAKEYSFNVDLTTGIQQLRHYKTTDYTIDTLPDPRDLENTLLAPEEILIDVTSGSFTDNFLPGEMKVYKIEGDNVVIFEDLAVPESSHGSGVYTGPQRISLMTGDTGAKIYYTVDGSYPEAGAEGTYLYEGPITLGAYGESKNYTIRAVSVRGTDVSSVFDLDMMIMDAPYNAAGGLVAKFTSLDGTRELTYEGFNGSPSNIKNLTDGSFDPFNSVLRTSEVGWAVLDLGEVKKIDGVSFSMWHDWWFGSVEIQVAKNADFSDAVTVYQKDSMQNVPNVGTSVTFDPIDARYVRMTNNCKGENQCSLFTELQVKTYYRAESNLLADTANWATLAQGAFSNDGNVIKETTPYQQSNWDKAYSYNARTYKNFMIDATMSIDVSDPAAWGYVGVQIFRDSTTVLQSNAGRGLVVGIEPKGRALLWDGSKEVGALDANIVGWSVGSTFDFKLVVYEGTISLAIDGRPVLNEYKPEYAGKSGYISIHSGLLPMTVTSFGITELTDENFTFATKGQAVQTTADVKVAVERYVAEADVISQLGDTVTVYDTAGKAYEVGVTWKADGYDRTQTGNFDFIGTLDKDDLKALNLSNVYGVNVIATVFVRSEVDKSVVENLISIANGLHSYEYTEESWEYLQLKVEAAEDILADPFLVQSDINVGMFQLYDAIYKFLVYAGDLTELNEAIAQANALDPAEYTEYSWVDYAAVIAEAEAYQAQTFKTVKGVEDQVKALKEAEKLLVKTATVQPELEITVPNVEPTTNSCNAGIGAEAGVAAMALAVAALVKGKKD